MSDDELRAFLRTVQENYAARALTFAHKTKREPKSTASKSSMPKPSLIDAL